MYDRKLGLLEQQVLELGGGTGARRYVEQIGHKVVGNPAGLPELDIL
jgi:hypothetical protein